MWQKPTGSDQSHRTLLTRQSPFVSPSSYLPFAVYLNPTLHAIFDSFDFRSTLRSNSGPVMSLGYLSRLISQAGMRVLQGMKDQATKYESNLRSLKDSAPSASSSSSSSSSKQARRFTSAVDSCGCRAGKNEKLRQAEESLRTVMYLSCWGPN